MNATLKRSIELMNKISPGAKVLYNSEWFTVKSIIPCTADVYKNKITDICYHCIGYIALEDGFLEDHNCYFIGNEIEFKDVIPSEIEFITKKDMML